MSSVIIGGQTLSLLLTLVAIPVIYSLFDDLDKARVWSTSAIARAWRTIVMSVTGRGRRAAPLTAPTFHKRFGQGEAP